MLRYRYKHVLKREGSGLEKPMTFHFAQGDLCSKHLKLNINLITTHKHEYSRRVNNFKILITTHTGNKPVLAPLVVAVERGGTIQWILSQNYILRAKPVVETRWTDTQHDH